MNTKTITSVAILALTVTLAVAGITYAATPAANDTSLLNKGTVEVDSLKVGKQGIGGVTFFNGTIVNNTTTNGSGNPVTFGDDVRVDGRVFRGDNAGAGLGDSKPFIINDDAQVAGSFTVGGTDIFAAIDAKVSKSSPAFDTQTSYLNVPAQEFGPSDSANGYAQSEIAIGPSTTDPMYAPVSLPHGAIITNVELIAVDADAGQNLNVKLYKNKYSNGSGIADASQKVEMASVATSGNSATTTEAASTSSINEATVDNSTAFYSLGADFPADLNTLQLLNVRITYTFTAPY